MKEEKNTVDERVQFLESLNKLVEMGKKKDGKINFSDINEQFKDIDLDGDKTEKILDYLEQNNYQINRIAVEMNEEILPKYSYSDTMLKDGDRLEVVTFVGGG